MELNQVANDMTDSSGSVLVCTLFDRGYLASGLAMIESILATGTCQFLFLVLALDDDTFKFLVDLDKKEIEPISLSDVMDEPLNQLRHERNWREFCWSLPADMLEAVASRNFNFEYVAYVDSDCFFFSDFHQLIDEMGENKSVLIHPHRFPETQKHKEFESGTYNVGVILGRKNLYFHQLLLSWKDEVFNECILDPVNGKCGDQTYLNNWPRTYNFVKVSQNHGIGAGPWNLESSRYSKDKGHIYLDGDELVFYHFSRFKPFFISKYFSLGGAALGYKVSAFVRHAVYRSYLKDYSIASLKVNYFFKFDSLAKIHLRHFVSAIQQSQMVTYLDFRLRKPGRRIR